MPTSAPGHGTPASASPSGYTPLSTHPRPPGIRLILGGGAAVPAPGLSSPAAFRVLVTFFYSKKGGSTATWPPSPGLEVAVPMANVPQSPELTVLRPASPQQAWPGVYPLTKVTCAGQRVQGLEARRLQRGVPRGPAGRCWAGSWEQCPVNSPGRTRTHRCRGRPADHRKRGLLLRNQEPGTGRQSPGG